jgi:outer membrane phospholipase A
LLVCFFTLIFLTSHPLRAEEGRPEPLQLETYKPIDFLLAKPYTKIDISFKTRLLQNQNVYFAYTQLMMWKLFYYNPYFYDLNYSPEFFYRSYVQGQKRWIDFAPFQHESNGFGYAKERSWNRSYVRYHSENSLNHRATILWSVTGWVPYNYETTVPDIIRYRGLYELNATISDFLGPFFEVGDLTIRLYPGGPSGLNPSAGGQELTFRFKLARQKFLPPLELQLFHGFGEDILDYKIRHTDVRVGFGF